MVWYSSRHYHAIWTTCAGIHDGYYVFGYRFYTFSVVLSTCFIEFGISGDVASSRKNWCALFVNGPDSLVYFSSACCHFHGLNCLNPIDNISNTVLFHHVFPLQFSYVFCNVCVYKPMRLTNFLLHDSLSVFTSPFVYRFSRFMLRILSDDLD